MILQILLLIHVLVSLTGIASGVVVLFGLLKAERLEGWTALFLTTTALTSVSGFFFPYHGFTPAIAMGIVSLVVVALALYAFYARRLNGGWRKVYVITAVLALYLNVFVAIVQAFLKIPALRALAPTQTEPIFKAAQLLAFALFVVLGIAAAMKFKIQPTQTT